MEAEGATETEQTAATELRNYLRRICGEWFEIVPEGAFEGGRPAIYVAQPPSPTSTACSRNVWRARSSSSSGLTMP